MSGNGILVASEGGELRGNITTLTHGLPITLRAHPRAGMSKDTPKYEVFTTARDREVCVGVAWEKTSEAGPNPGSKFLTLTIDDPSFDAPLNVTAFPRDGGGYEIVWRRTRGRVDGQNV